MSAHQAVFPIATMARVLGVSKAGYYAWLRRSPSARAVADRVLMKQIRTIHVTSHETYGVPRIHAELRAAGEKHGRKRIARLMRAAAQPLNRSPETPCLALVAALRHRLTTSLNDNEDPQWSARRPLETRSFQWLRTPPAQSQPQ